MGVKFRSFSIGQPSGGGAGQTSFSDTFIRADQPNYLGTDWLTIYCSTETTLRSGVDLANAIACTGTEAVFGNQIFASGAAYLIPAKLDYNFVNGLAQFAEVTINSVVGTGVTIGPAVFMQANRNASYAGIYQPAVAGSALFRNTPGGSILGGGPFATVAGDVLRVEVTPSGASNNVKLIINGVTVVNNTDSNAARPTFGMPGIYWVSGAGGSTVGLINFSCGLL